MKRFSSHLAAVGIAVLVMVGITRLPAVRGLGLPSLFTLAWTLLALLALLAHMRQAKLIGQPRQLKRPVYPRLRKRGL